ncbi:glycosyl transferase family 1 [Pseudomonas sp. PIC25]|uniref:glycosyltransferase family 4 protein n=1 Tax=Pseudomonas sp. PIC25 TaxID=1958773 RepID=UPI000BAB732D|nr:glycosyltransferase family 4 protein [Pseudomonas sp. PIC25]PAU66688.1 glycosyl transferase family 1 [Pseudomonas sp. PIC25]
MRILIIHQNFPGQFRHVARCLLAQPGVEVLAIGRDTAPGLAGVPLLRYKPHRTASEAIHPYLRPFEDGVLHGQQVLRLLLDLKRKGYRPDIILAHPGWGETLFARDAFPAARLIHFCEFYYHAHGADANFDPEFPLDLDGAARIRTRNALHLLNLEHCDQGIAPTRWQLDLHPEAYRYKLIQLHEGIDTRVLQPDPRATLPLPNGTVLRAGMPVLTYVARNLEPYRGFHTFMRALPSILREHPDCQVVVIGGDDVSYGGRPKDAENWRSKLLRENPVDPAHVHFLGKVPYATYRQALQVSAIHTYLTYPFVLSWSLLEAMACGCLIVASDTAPVREAIQHGENGLLVDFFDPQALAEAALDALNNPARHLEKRKQARRTAEGYDIEVGNGRYLELMGVSRG